MTMAKNIAVIGAGYWGRNLVRNYANLSALSMICDRSAAILGQFREQYPDVETCLTLSDVLSRPEVQGVAIATPAETHYRIAREALLSGKHVFVEKPLVLHEKEAEELIRSHPVDGVVLMGGCDKTTPGLLLGATSAGAPAIFVAPYMVRLLNGCSSVIGSCRAVP